MLFNYCVVSIIYLKLIVFKKLIGTLKQSLLLPKYLMLRMHEKNISKTPLDQRF